MTEKQFAAIVANMHAQSAYQQVLIGHLVGLVHGVEEVVVEIGAQCGMSPEDLRSKFATATRKMDNTLAEMPFPEFRWSDGDSPSSDSSPLSPPPHDP